MSMSSSRSTPRQDDSSDLARAARPITAPEAALIEEEARERAGETGQEVMGERRRGRVEAEAHRISDEMTHRAQEQRRVAEHAQTPAPAPWPAARATSRQLLPASGAIKRVVVPVSGDEFAQRAIPYAIAVARVTGASLTLVHVGDPPLSEPLAALERVPAALARDTTPTAFSELAGQSPPFGHLWQQAAHQLAGIEWLNLPGGSVTQSLLSLAAPDGSDLVVLATRRHAGAEGDTLGTVASTLIRHGRAPVLIIPPGVAVPDEGQSSFRRILVPLDGSALAEQALAPLMSVTRGRPDAAAGSGSGAGDGLHEIVLFSAVEAQQALKDADQYLRDLCERLESSAPGTLRFSMEARVGSVPGAIVATAAQGDEAMREHPTPFDLVALATHGRGGLRRWLLGSVAEYVVTHAAVPVLVVRPTLPPQVED